MYVFLREPFTGSLLGDGDGLLSTLLFLFILDWTGDDGDGKFFFLSKLSW